MTSADILLIDSTNGDVKSILKVEGFNITRVLLYHD
jgi:hypothetical protein